jgi:hypothetical protein
LDLENVNSVYRVNLAGIRPTVDIEHVNKEVSDRSNSDSEVNISQPSFAKEEPGTII